ncbi:MAG TPA: hypothetical protein VFD06_06745 [Candidatus Polarisedimenticolia bacterium]|nr:hypothetical protein [Candidatus Polarisedimenticolia bacterium]
MTPRPRPRTHHDAAWFVRTLPRVVAVLLIAAAASWTAAMSAPEELLYTPATSPEPDRSVDLLGEASGWVLPNETTLDSFDAIESADRGTADNLCEGINGILTGADPGWVRVGGSNDPFTSFTEARGQVLPDFNFKTNPFVNHTDAPFTHYAHDLNVFVTLDAGYRHLLASGNFELGDPSEFGTLELEWERGGIPMFAWPSPHDRITVWGPWVFDCGHGEPDENDSDVALSDAKYRTEIHSPVGWVVYRNTSNMTDRDGTPRPEKRMANPWTWYEADDFPGMGVPLPGMGGTLDTPIKATVADAFFSSFAGNIPEGLNGCDDTTVVSDDTIDSTCFYTLSAETFEWAAPLLQQDYSFFIPAPPKPASDPDATLVWDSEDHCAQVPSNPANPPGDDVEDVFEADDGAENIGSPACNIPDEVFPGEIVAGQIGIRVVVRASTGGVDYPANKYIAFAKRYKVGWDHVDPDAQRPHSYQVDFQTLKVIDDTDSDTGGDGEWVVSLRANDKWIHPVRGHGDDDEPFWEGGALAPDTDYSIGQSLTVTPLAGQPVRVWMKGWDDDNAPITHNNNFNDILPTVNEYHLLADHRLPTPGTPLSFAVDGTPSFLGDEWEGGGAYKLSYTITDVTDPQAPDCCILYGQPKYGPNADTGGLLRVNGTDAHETPIFLVNAQADGLEWRSWRVADAIPAGWSFDLDASDQLRIELFGLASDSGTYNVQSAPVLTTDSRQIVSPRTRVQLQLDNTPPALVVPGPVAVFADGTAGAHVDYTVGVSDNFPGPIDYACVPPSGALFPNGKNAPQTTTVTCTATDTVENQSVETFDVTVTSPFGYLKDFVALGLEWTKLAGGVVVQSGNVGAFDSSAGVPNNPGFEVVTASSTNLGSASTAACPSSSPPNAPQIAAESEKLGNLSSSGDVFFVTPISAGNGSQHNPCPGYVPLFLGLPIAPPNGPGGADIQLSGSQTLGPGAYGKLSVKPNAVVTFTGGSYTFAAIEVKPGATVTFAAPSTVVVAGRVLIADGGRIGPSSSGGFASRDIVLYVNGADGPPNNPSDAFSAGTGAVVRVNAFVPNGTLSMGTSTAGTGAFIGRRVSFGTSVVLALDSSFIVP